MPFKSLFGAFGANTTNVVDTFLSVIIKTHMELDEIAKIYSEKLDSIIRDEQSKDLNYVGGTFKISYANEKNFHLAFELYFQDKNEEFVKKESKSKPQSTEYLSEKALTELRAKKEISYEIDEPEPVKSEPQTEPEVRKMPKSSKENNK